MSVQSLVGTPMIRQIVASGTPTESVDTTSTDPSPRSPPSAAAWRATSTKRETNVQASSAKSDSRRLIAPRAEGWHRQHAEVGVLRSVAVHHVQRLVRIPPPAFGLADLEVVESGQPLVGVETKDRPAVDEHLGLALDLLDVVVAGHDPARRDTRPLVTVDRGDVAEHVPGAPREPVLDVSGGGRDVELVEIVGVHGHGHRHLHSPSSTLTADRAGRRPGRGVPRTCRSSRGCRERCVSWGRRWTRHADPVRRNGSPSSAPRQVFCAGSTSAARLDKTTTSRRCPTASGRATPRSAPSCEARRSPAAMNSATSSSRRSPSGAGCRWAWFDDVEQLLGLRSSTGWCEGPRRRCLAAAEPPRASAAGVGAATDADCSRVRLIAAIPASMRPAMAGPRSAGSTSVVHTKRVRSGSSTTWTTVSTGSLRTALSTPRRSDRKRWLRTFSPQWRGSSRTSPSRWTSTSRAAMWSVPSVATAVRQARQGTSLDIERGHRGG